MKPIDVLCVGVTSYDLYFTVDHHPRPDEKATAEALVACGGGPAANAAITVARMGLSAAFAGYLGNDVWGDLHLMELQQAGVQTDWIVRGSNPTPISAVWVKPDGRRSLVSYRAPSAVLADNRVDFTHIEPKVMLFDGHEPALSVRALDLARRGGIKTVLDAGSVNPGTSSLYAEVDYLICSEKFAKAMTDGSDGEEALTQLSRFNRNVVITLGDKGLIWKTERESGACAAFPVETVDTTGAGDVFHGAFAGCVAAGKTWHETLRYASAAAALCCTKLGGRTSIPTIEEVDRFLSGSSALPPDPPAFGSFS